VKTYLALGDSMSIDAYTGIAGGGSVARFGAMLGPTWRVVDRTFDGCLMGEVDVTPPNTTTALVTMTIGGNDLLGHLERYLESGDPSELDDTVVRAFVDEHRALLHSLRAAHPTAHLVIANIYRPDLPLPPEVTRVLDAINAHIAANTAAIKASLADVHGALSGQESAALTQQIEPNLVGAGLIAEAFAAAAPMFAKP